jgi:hypothetical protein
MIRWVRASCHFTAVGLVPLGSAGAVGVHHGSALYCPVPYLCICASRRLCK